MLLVPEKLDGEPGQAVRLLEPAKLARCDVELQQPVGGVGVVLQEARVLRPPVAVAPEQPAFVIRERAEQELADPPCGVEEVAAFEAAAGLGKRCQGEAVPRGDRLVVPGGLRPLLAELPEPAPEVLVELAADDRAAVLEGLEQLLGAPSSAVHVNVSPSTPSVSASCAEAKAALREGELPEDVVEGLLGDLAGSAPRR